MFIQILFNFSLFEGFQKLKGLNDVPWSGQLLGHLICPFYSWHHVTVLWVYCLFNSIIFITLLFPVIKLPLPEIVYNLTYIYWWLIINFTNLQALLHHTRVLLKDQLCWCNNPVKTLKIKNAQALKVSSSNTLPLLCIWRWKLLVLLPSVLPHVY